MDLQKQRFQEMLRRIEIDDQGRLKLMGVRSIITPAGSLLGIMEASNDILGERGTWIIMYRAGYNTALAFAQTMIEIHKLDPNHIALTYTDFAHMRGWGTFKLIGMDFVNGHAQLHVDNSIFAEYFLEQGGTDHPVCAFLAGALAGITNAVSGMQVRAKESQCVAMGGEFCEIAVAPF